MQMKQQPTPLPEWWKESYAANAKYIPKEWYQGLMDSISARDLWNSIKNIPSSKAPGIDKVSIHMLKICCEIPKKQTMAPPMAIIIRT